MDEACQGEGELELQTAQSVKVSAEVARWQRREQQGAALPRPERMGKEVERFQRGEARPESCGSHKAG